MMKKVKDIMLTQMEVLHPKDKLQVAKEYFQTHELHHLPVAVMGDIKGILSLGDILFLEGFVTNSFDEFLRTKKYQMTTIDEFMTANPYCIDEDATIADALDILLEKRVNALPVKKDGKFAGMITSYLLLKEFREELK